MSYNNNNNNNTNNSSTMSFAQRFAADAAHAAHDAYSNWILGDDAGKSALLTLVLRPTAKAQTTTNNCAQSLPFKPMIASSIVNSSNNNNNNNHHTAQQQHHQQQQQQQQQQSPFQNRSTAPDTSTVTTQQAHTATSANNSTLQQQQQQQQQQPAAAAAARSSCCCFLLDLGMTFIEINGRAYVKSVAPGSAADQAGILPQDAVQYATVFRKEWYSNNNGNNNNNNITGNNNNQSNNNSTSSEQVESSSSPATMGNGNNVMMMMNMIEDTITEEEQDAVAVKRVLMMEQQGLRLSYDELRNLLVTAHNANNNNNMMMMMMDPNIQSAFLSPPTTSKHHLNGTMASRMYNATSWASGGPPIPSNICVPMGSSSSSPTSSSSTATGGMTYSDENNNGAVVGGAHDSSPHHHHHRHQNSNGRRSNVAVAASGGSNTAGAVAPSSSFNSSNNSRPNSPHLFSNVGEHHYPRPVVFCFRRTRQRKVLHNLGMPKFRLDDECDFASCLVKRLAPTTDMETPNPDTWEELVHDGTDWLLGTGSMLPPKNAMINNNNNTSSGNEPSSNNHGTSGTHHQHQHLHHHQQQNAPSSGSSIASFAGHNHNNNNNNTANNHNNNNNDDDDDLAIPLDEEERHRAKKLASLRSRMAAEAMRVDRTEDVEAVTIRGMIQKAVGLAFVRASKVVLGISVHAGSGIVIARLSDGTWSAPSAIGTWGLGLGLQFGLEVAEYIFILQTREALEHFRRGGSFTVGGNIGLAVAGVGREAYGAASVGGTCGNPNTVKDDEYNDNDSRDDDYQPQSLAIAPIVAYAKSQGLYVGVSLEGSRIFARDDINSRTYKFSAGRDVSACDILCGKVSTPPEAEELYAALHSVEFTHEMSCLPRPPEILRRDSANAWFFDSSTLGARFAHAKSPPFAFLPSLTKEEGDECEAFETQFKKFMYGGVSVQRLLPDTDGRSGRTGKERRTLWLMLPEVGSLRLGFVSKLSDGESTVSNKNSTQRARREDSSRLSGFDADLGTVGSEEVTLDSALHTKDGGSTIGHIRTGNVQLSSKHSVALTDVCVLSQEPLFPVRFKGEDKMEHLRVISIQDVAGTSLLFLANNFREAELLVCGLKLLLERETARLGVRGGMPQSSFGVRRNERSMSPSAARGYRNLPESGMESRSAIARQRRSPRASKSGYATSDAESVGTSVSPSGRRGNLPDDRRAWGNVPGRNYMRGQAAAFSSDSGKRGYNEHGVPHYVHGQQLLRELAKNVRLPLPLPLCRVLLLDSTSPVIKKWEIDRGDKNFDKSRWAFPPATPRELERHASEHQLIAMGSMCDAHRTLIFDRPRYGALVRLSETHTVEADDSKELVFAVTERNPRRGFSIKVRVILRAFRENSCDASVLADIRPVGKDMSNQAAVHKACMLVVDEIKDRYGADGSGLLAGFLSVVDNMADGSKSSASSSNKSISRPFPRTGPNVEEKKSDRGFSPSRSKKESTTKESGLVSFEDMLKTGRESPETTPIDRPSTPSLLHQIPEADPAKRMLAKPSSMTESDNFEEAVPEKKEPVLIEVKPLPKIRLSLMPAPREEDEENSSSGGSPVPSKPVRKKKPSSRGKKSKPGRRVK